MIKLKNNTQIIKTRNDTTPIHLNRIDRRKIV
jgi:hypothetical protein